MADACVCMGVSDDAIRQAVVEGAQTFEEVRLATGSSGGCGGCEEQNRIRIPSPAECHEKGWIGINSEKLSRLFPAVQR